MRQLCPNCLKQIDVPESAAGTDFPCPSCGKPFPVPAAYTPTVTAPPPPPAADIVPPPPTDRPPPPPGLAPGAFGPPAAPPPAADPGDMKEVGFRLSPEVLAWVPVAALTIALLLTFFAWVGTHPGGQRQYTQSPWQGLFRSMSTSGLPAEVLADETALEAALPRNVLFMLPYLLLLVGATALAWLERVFREPTTARSGLLARLPADRELPTVLAGLTLVLLLLALIQVWRGFGLEEAAERLAAERANADPRVQAMADKPDSTPKRQVATVVYGEKLGQFNLDDTLAEDLALLAHVVAVLAMAGRLWLARRGDRPPPRVVLRY